MSFAPIFATLKAASAVTALVGTNPVRVFPMGEAPQKGTTGFAVPYVVYQQITGSPENYIGDAPDSDDSLTQISVYADTVSSARAVSVAIRDAVQTKSYVESIREMGRDPDTNLCRVDLDVAWITRRT